jgi:hypothetical protein
MTSSRRASTCPVNHTPEKKQSTGERVAKRANTGAAQAGKDSDPGREGGMRESDSDDDAFASPDDWHDDAAGMDDRDWYDPEILAGMNFRTDRDTPDSHGLDLESNFLTRNYDAIPTPMPANVAAAAAGGRHLQDRRDAQPPGRAINFDSDHPSQNAQAQAPTTSTGVAMTAGDRRILNYVAMTNRQLLATEFGQVVAKNGWDAKTKRGKAQIEAAFTQQVEQWLGRTDTREIAFGPRNAAQTRIESADYHLNTTNPDTGEVALGIPTHWLGREGRRDGFNQQAGRLAPRRK